MVLLNNGRSYNLNKLNYDIHVSDLELGLVKIKSGFRNITEGSDYLKILEIVKKSGQQ